MDILASFQSPFDAFSASRERTPQAPFLIVPRGAGLEYAPDGLRISYAELAESVRSLATRFRQAGYGQAQRIALILDNRPEFFAHWLALNEIGCSIVPINADLRKDEFCFRFATARTELLVASENHMDQARLAANIAGVPAICVGEQLPGARARARLGNEAGRDLDAECAVLFTSGSTGKPKGCMLSNRYFLQVAEWYLRQGGHAEIRHGAEVNLTPLPMFHMNALGCSAVGMMAAGGAIAPLDRFHASRWWQSVCESGATVVHCLGVIPAILLQLPQIEYERLHSVRFAFAPGVERRRRLQFEERFGTTIVDAWAMTETGGAASTTTAREPRGFAAGCIGRASSDMEFRLVNDEGADVAAGQPGELIVRARGAKPRSGFFSGYVNDEAATEDAWKDGWFHTGDYVREQDGLLYFFDRKKSIIRRSGENIAVTEVEAILNGLPGVRGSAVAPVADDLRGEEVFAFVVMDEEAVPGLDERQAIDIVRSCAESLAYHKLPGYMTFRSELPLSATKKLARGDIKKLAADAVGDRRCFDLRDLKSQLRKRSK